MATTAEISADLVSKVGQPVADQFNRIVAKLQAAATLPTVEKNLLSTQAAVASLKAAMVYIDAN